jgi:hypothetical protein
VERPQRGRAEIAPPGWSGPSSNPAQSGRVQQQRDGENEPAHGEFILGTEQGGQISDRTKIGFYDAAFAINTGLLDLQAGKALGLDGALGDKLAPGLALLVGERHRGAGAAFAGRLLDRAVYLSNTPVQVRYDPDLYVQPGIYIGALGEGSDLAGDGLSDVGGAQSNIDSKMSLESASSIQKVDSYDSIVARQRHAADFFNSIGP